MRGACCGALLLAASIFGATGAQADVVLEWNEIMPANETRLAAITQLAVFEAVNAVTREYHPDLGTVTAPADESAETAAVAAAHAVLKNYVPGGPATLDEARTGSLGRILEGSAKETGIEVGEAAAASSSALGGWQLTPGCPESSGVLLHWRNVTPLEHTSQPTTPSWNPDAHACRAGGSSRHELRAAGHDKVDG